MTLATACALTNTAQGSHKALCNDMPKCRFQVMGVNAEMSEAARRVTGALGVQRSKHEVARLSGLNGDFRGFLVSDLADHQNVRILT